MKNKYIFLSAIMFNILFAQISISDLNKISNQQLDAIKNEVGEDRFNNGQFDMASKLFKEMILKDDFDEFLTLPAYKYI